MKSDLEAAWATDLRPVLRAPTLEAYALWASTYDSDPNPILALEARVLEALLPDVEGRFVLDVGCGTGQWLTRLLARGARDGAGIDLSAEMLARAAEKSPLRGRLVRADGAQIPVRSGVADVVVCSLLIGYLESLQGLAGELARSMRQGAHLFITELHPSCAARGWRRTFRHAGETFEMATTPHSMEEIRATFKARGFALRALMEPSLGEPERPIFERQGKLAQFATACEGPALLACHFELVRHS